MINIPNLARCLTTIFLLTAVASAHADTAGTASSPRPVDASIDVPVSPALSWDPVDTATSYTVAFGTSNPPPVVATGRKTTTYRPAGIAFGKTYYWRINVVVNGGTAAGSVWKFTTASAPPAMVTGESPVTGSNLVSVNGALSWVGSSSATSYDVAIGTTNPPPVVSAEQAAVTYRPDTLAYSTTYYWKVDTRGAGGVTKGAMWSFTTASAPAPPISGTTTLDRLRLMTWNVQAGRDINGNSTVDAQAAAMAASGADVIGLQEVAVSARYGNLPALYKSKLESLTGVAWFSVWIPEPRPATAMTQGSLILSRLPIVDSATTQLDSAPGNPTLLDAKRAAGRIVVSVNGVLVNVIITHFAVNRGQRQTQLDLFQTWVSSLPAPRLVGGTLNMTPGDAAYLDLNRTVQDTWRMLVGTTDAGFTKDVFDVAPSTPGRLDYWWHELTDLHAVPTEISVVQSSLSDHRAVVIDVDVR